jgi:glycosyltransferase involved in cell wall biosynthesis
MVAKNEEQLIGLALSSVKEIAHELIVVDTGSTDRTVRIARQQGAQVVLYPWDGSLGRARNAYLRAASGDWILVLDADETISKIDLARLKQLANRRSVIGYMLAIRNYTDGFDLMWNWYPNDRRYPREEKFSACPGWAKTQPLRLFRNFPKLKYVEGTSVHTTPMASLLRHPGRVEKRDDVVIHHFQYLKGGGSFLAAKQKLRLDGEMQHAKKFPRDPQTYLNIARTLFAANRDQQAVRHLLKAIKLDRNFHDALQLLGMIHFERADWSNAEKYLRRAIQIDPQSADAWAILGMVFVDSAQLDQAFAALEQAIKLRPNHLLAHNSLGVLYEDLGQHQKARRQYLRALELHSKFSPAKVNLARLSRKLARRKQRRARP